MKKLLTMLLCFVMLLSLTACVVEITDDPNTSTTQCSHTYMEATCTAAKTCSICGETQGQPLGHDAANWVVKTAPTCSIKGTEEATCSRCAQTVSREIACLPHTLGEWEIASEPTLDKDGLKVQKCTVCGSTVNEEKYQLTQSQKNVLKEAKSYLELMSFSKSGLIKQLEFEGYTNEQIDFAVNHLEVNWNEECLESAEEYVELMSFSQKGLKKQLEFEGYTNEQIDFAVNHLEVNWNEECYECAKNYLELMSFSKSGLIKQLEFEGYTDEQINYAIQKVGY